MSMYIREFKNDKTESFKTIRDTDNNIIFTEDVYKSCVDNICKLFHVASFHEVICNSETCVMVVYNTRECEITLEQFANLIIEESKQNIWFFFREILRVPVQGSNICGHMEMTRGTYVFIDAYERGLNGAFLYNPRQTFNTGILVALYIYTKLFKRNCCVIHRCRDTNSEALFNRKVSEMINALPKLFITLCHDTILRNTYLSSVTSIYMFIDEYEFNKGSYITDEQFEEYRKSNVFVFASSTINDNIPKIYLDALNKYTYLVDDVEFPKYVSMPRIMIPAQKIMTDEALEQMKILLNHDEKVINREIYRIRNN